VIRKIQFLFCDNEHGTGDVCFPDVSGTEDSVMRTIVNGNTARSLRAAAKKEGWGRVGGGDYCPACMESI